MIFYHYKTVLLILAAIFVVAIDALNLPTSNFVKRTQVLPFATPSCGTTDPKNLCTIPCAEDPDCQTIGFDVSVYSCAFPAQICSDGNIYGPPDYDRGKPLTAEQIAQQPHISASCFPNGCVPAAIAPNKKQIGNCG